MFNQNELNEMTRRYQDWNAQFKQPLNMFQNDKPSLFQQFMAHLRRGLPNMSNLSSLRRQVLRHNSARRLQAR